MHTTKIAAVLVGFLFAGLTFASADDKAKDPTKLDPAKVQKLFEAFAKPGKPHKQLRRLVGRWNAEIISYMGPKPTTSTGSSVFRATMGGRYIIQNYRGTFEGQPFQGMGISGYDNAKKKYVSAWIDSMGTGIMLSEGSYDPKTHALTEVGTSSSPIGDMKMKMVSKYEDRDHFSMTMYMITDKGEQKSMVVKYTRDKSKGKKRKKGGKKKGKKAKT